MLCDKYRVATHRCLLAVIGQVCGRQALAYEVTRVIHDQRQALALQISLIPGIQLEVAAEA